MNEERIRELRFKNRDCGHAINSVIDECLDHIELLRSELQKMDGRWVLLENGEIIKVKDLLKDCPKTSEKDLRCRKSQITSFTPETSGIDADKTEEASANPSSSEGVDEKELARCKVHCRSMKGKCFICGDQLKPQPQLPEKLEYKESKHHDGYPSQWDYLNTINGILDYLASKHDSERGGV